MNIMPTGEYPDTSLRLVLRRMRQRALMVEHLAKVTAIYPGAARLALIKMLSLVFWLGADEPADVFSPAEFRSWLNRQHPRAEA
jgi:hypothetical protein